jgi:hypothetical protein
MNIFEDTNPKKLSDLLTLIDMGEMALPDFQRSFIWDPGATQELITSIASNYPAGSLLRVRDPNTQFAVREFEGAPKLNGKKPIYLILDGQQRLTSLYQAFYGKGEHRYFVRLGYLLDGKDFEESVFHLRAGKAAKKYNSLEQQAGELVLPLEQIYGQHNGYFNWRDDIFETQGQNREKKKALRDIYKQWIEPIEHYEFPVVTLSDRTGADAVCTIFETLNRTGVKLSVFELLTARFWPKNVNLRSLLDDSKKKYTLLDEFDIDPYYILQAISLLIPDKAPSCKKRDLLNELTSAYINSFWDTVTEGFENVLKLLYEECGVLSPGWLPYAPMLIPAAAFWAKQEAGVGIKAGVMRSKLIQWIWCSIFSQAYENAPNSQAAKDFSQLNLWASSGEEPETVKQFKFDIDQLRETTPRQRAVYRGIICMILSNGPIDFFERKKITPKLLKDNKIDDHHIFPYAYLETIGTPKVNRDSVLNRTLIDRNTNMSIGKKPPSAYLPAIEQEMGRETLNNIVTSHLMAETLEKMENEAFEPFIENRLEIFRQQMERLTGKTIEKSDGKFEAR